MYRFRRQELIAEIAEEQRTAEGLASGTLSGEAARMAAAQRTPPCQQPLRRPAPRRPPRLSFPGTEELRPTDAAAIRSARGRREERRASPSSARRTQRISCPSSGRASLVSVQRIEVERHRALRVVRVWSSAAARGRRCRVELLANLAAQRLVVRFVRVDLAAGKLPHARRGARPRCRRVTRKRSSASMTAATTTIASCGGASRPWRGRVRRACLGVNGFWSSGSRPRRCRAPRWRRRCSPTCRGPEGADVCCSSRAARFGPLRPGMTTSVTSRCGSDAGRLGQLERFLGVARLVAPCSRGGAAPSPPARGPSRCPRPGAASRCRLGRSPRRGLGRCRFPATLSVTGR